MSETSLLFRVFISHSSIDTWVAKQIAQQVEFCGASTFLDEADIEYGDDFEDKILEAARNSEELLVLMTPWATSRPYIWLEMGVFWGQGKRIVGILHGMSAKELSTQESMPALLKRIDLVDINKIDSYFAQLAGRVKGRK
jgi:hypothetical protein